MNFKDSWILPLFFGLLFIVIMYFINTPFLPLCLMLAFIIVKGLECHKKINLNSEQIKGICYFGLGVITIIGIGVQKTDNTGAYFYDISSSYYVATMCFIEFFSLYFNWKKPEETYSKKHSEALDKIHNTRSKKARIAKTHKKA